MQITLKTHGPNDGDNLTQFRFLQQILTGIYCTLLKLQCLKSLRAQSVQPYEKKADPPHSLIHSSARRQPTELFLLSEALADRFQHVDWNYLDDSKTTTQSV